MANYFFFHDLDTCIGCQACQVACKDLHDLPAGEFFRRVVQVSVNGKARFYSAACSHCAHPACMAACPNGAYYRGEDGTVLHDEGKCIGCGRCVWSCPYGAVVLRKETGTAQKCDGCYDRRRQGLEPACVAACVNRSLQFGRTDGRCDESRLGAGLPGVLPAPSLTLPRFRVCCGQGVETV